MSQNDLHIDMLKVFLVLLLNKYLMVAFNATTLQYVLLVLSIIYTGIRIYKEVRNTKTNP